MTTTKAAGMHFGATHNAGGDAPYTLDELGDLPCRAVVWGVYTDHVEVAPAGVAWSVKREYPYREFYATERRALERLSELFDATTKEG